MAQGTQTVIDLGKLVKSKYPGAYDDMDDAVLGRQVRSKYPDAYADFEDIQPFQSAAQSAEGIRGPLSLTEKATNIARDIGSYAKKATEWAIEHGPPIVGAAGGAAIGAPLGPAGIATGAAFGAGGGRAIQRLTGIAAGDRPDPNEVAGDIATQMALGPVQEAVPIVRGVTGVTGRVIAPMSRQPLVTRAQQLGAEFDVPLDIAQQTQGPILSPLRNVLVRMFGSGGVFRRFQREFTNEGLKKAGDDIAEEISKVQLTPHQAGSFFRAAMREYDQALGTVYRDVISRIEAKGGSSALIPSDDVADVASGLIKDLKVGINRNPALGRNESINQTIDLLQGFANWRNATQATRQTAVRQLETQAPGKVVQTEGTRVTPVLGIRTQSGFKGTATRGTDAPVTPESGVSGLGRTTRVGGKTPGMIRSGEVPGTGKLDVVAQRRSKIPGPEVEVPGDILPARVTDVVTTQVPGPEVLEPVSWAEAQRLRSLLSEMTRLPELNFGKSRIGKVTHAIDGAMESALRKRGMDAEAEAFREASTAFRLGRENLELSIIDKAATEDKPELIVGMLTGGGSETAFRAINEMLSRQPTMRDAIKREAWEHIFRSTQTEDIVVGNRLEKAIADIGDDALRTMFGPDMTAKMKRLAEVANIAHIPANLTKPATEQSVSLIMQGVAGSTAAGLGMMFWNPVAGALTLIAGPTMMTIPPYLAARWLTNPRAVDLATRAMRTKPGTREAFRLRNEILTGLGLRGLIEPPPSLRQLDVGEDVDETEGVTVP